MENFKNVDDITTVVESEVENGAEDNTDNEEKLLKMLKYLSEHNDFYKSVSRSMEFLIRSMLCNGQYSHGKNYKKTEVICFRTDTRQSILINTFEGKCYLVYLESL